MPFYVYKWMVDGLEYVRGAEALRPDSRQTCEQVWSGPSTEDNGCLVPGAWFLVPGDKPFLNMALFLVKIKRGYHVKFGYPTDHCSWF